MNRFNFDVSRIAPPPQSVVSATRNWILSQDLPLIVEVGCGVGLHPIQTAQLNPNRKILAIERTSEKFHRFNSRMKNHALSNLMGVQAEATRLLPFILTHESVSEFFFLYPNPYPKASQKNLRWGNSPFMSFVFHVLQFNGRVTFATNIISYAQELAKNIPLYGFTLETFDPLDLNFTARTHFEKKYLAEGQTCYNLVFSKPALRPVSF